MNTVKTGNDSTLYSLCTTEIGNACV